MKDFPGKSLLELAIAIASIPVYALSVELLWGWFVVPLGVAAIGKAHAFGLSLLFSLISRQKQKASKESALFDACLAMAIPLFWMGAGWICHWMMLP